MIMLKISCASCKYLAYFSSATLVPSVFVGVWPAVLLGLPDANALEQALVTVGAIFLALALNGAIWDGLRDVYMHLECMIDEA